MHNITYGKGLRVTLCDRTIPGTCILCKVTPVSYAVRINPNVYACTGCALTIFVSYIQVVNTRSILERCYTIRRAALHVTLPVIYNVIIVYCLHCSVSGVFAVSLFVIF